MPSPGSTDDALLARLNALKKSSVSFDTSHHSSIAPSNPSASTTTPPADSLAARFARLGSPSPSPSPEPSRTTSINTNKVPIVAPGAPSYLEGVAGGIGAGDKKAEFNEEDERSLEELLSELGDRKDWDANDEEAQDVGEMLRDVKSILPKIQESRNHTEDPPVDSVRLSGKEGLTGWENVEVDFESGDAKIGRRIETEQRDREDGENHEKKNEDDETDDVIARIMAELAIEKKYDTSAYDQDPNPKNEESSVGEALPDTDTNTEVSLPSAPTSLPSPPSDSTTTQAIEDALTARFASLSSPSPTPATDSLGLPSAPSFHPSQKPPTIISKVKHTDEEIDTWCIICNDDATLRCLGCDDDLYCQNCWMEGHRGPDAGFEEKRHKAVLYSKKKKQPVIAG